MDAGRCGSVTCRRVAVRWCVSNGPTDAIDELIKKVKRIPRGLPQLHQLLAPLLLAAGMDWTTVDWQGPPATPL